MYVTIKRKQNIKAPEFKCLDIMLWNLGGNFSY